MTATEDILAAIEKSKSSLQDIELMINSVGRHLSSFLVVDAKLPLRMHANPLTYMALSTIHTARYNPVPGSAFREHAKFTYTALESLSKQAIGAEALLNELQALELSKLQGPSPLSIKSKQEEAEEAQQASNITPQSPFGAESTLGSLKRREYLNLSIDDTLRWFK
ncbi:hypothetical protein BGZ68_001745, partial [Mortierella alpina]